MILEHEKLFLSLKDKIRTIQTLYERAKDEKSSLLRDRADLENKLKKKDEEFEELSRKYNLLKLAKTVEHTAEDSHEAKIKLNRIVREIDRCIALLNK